MGNFVKNLWTVIEIVSAVGPFIVAVYMLTLQEIAPIKRFFLSVVFSIISVSNLFIIFKDKKDKEAKSEADRYYRNIWERNALSSYGLQEEYISDLGERPMIKHNFKKGFELQKKEMCHKAITKFKECLDNPQASDYDKVLAHNSIGICYINLSKLKEAKAHIKTIKKNVSKFKNKKKRLNVQYHFFNNMGLIYSIQGKLNKALDYFQKSMKITQKLGSSQGLANTHGNIGSIYRMKKDIDKAHKYCKKSLEIARGSGLYQIQATQLSNMGLILLRKGDFDGALENYQQALAICQEKRYRFTLAEILIGIGLTYIFIRNYNKAEKYFHEALDVTREIGSRREEALALGNIGLVYSKYGRSVEALRYFEDAQVILKKIGADLDIKKTEMNIQLIQAKMKGKASDENN